MKRIYLLLSLSFAFSAMRAQLIINEVSQGATGAKEYVELLVTGNPVCGGANTVDLRGWIIDDNNSWHGTGSGAGIAGGHVRFPAISQWANVKIGTLIVIYNEADVNANVAALGVDTNDANGDCVFVIPASSSVLEKNTTLPASSGNMTSYATGSPAYSTTGTWTVLGMANSDDAFHTVSPTNYATSYHAVGWGSDTAQLNVYFSASQTGKTMYMTNAVDNNPFNQANWKDTAFAVETPGAPNNSANAAWIHSLNNNCQPFLPPVVTINSPSPLTCSNTTSVISVSSVTSGLTYTWSNSISGTNDTVSSAGVYYVTASDGICSTTDSATVTSTGSLTLSLSSSNTTCGNNNGSASVTVTGGTPTGYSWSSGGTTSSVSGLAAGTYYVTVSATGGCNSIDSVVIGSSSLAPVTITSANDTLCGGDSTQICAPGGYVSYQWNLGGTNSCTYATQAGNYYVTVTDNANCTATSNHLPVFYYPVPSVSISVNGDSLTAGAAVAYQWYRDGNLIPNATNSVYVATVSGNYTLEVTDANGCHAISNPSTVTVTGINKINGNDVLTVYPNPVSTANWQLTVDNSLIGNAMEVFDAAGKLIYKTTVTSTKTEIELNVAKGIYLLKLYSIQGTITRKLIRF